MKMWALWNSDNIFEFQAVNVHPAKFGGGGQAQQQVEPAGVRIREAIRCHHFQNAFVPALLLTLLAASSLISFYVKQAVVSLLNNCHNPYPLTLIEEKHRTVKPPPDGD